MLTVAVVGATGAVGRQMLDILESRSYPVSKIKPLASERSAGTTVEFAGKESKVELLTADSFEGVDVALFSAGGDVSREFCPIAAEAGAIVIDNSSAFRMDDRVPLGVPEVNGDLLRSFLTALPQGKGAIIANPNCSTIQLVVALKPLHDAATIKRVVVSTYQSVAGAGQKGIDELSNQVLALFRQDEISVKHFPHQIAFNCIPQIDVFTDNGYSKEELKVINESRKILSLPGLKITATAVRVPTFSCHAESVNIEFEKKLTPDEARTILRQSPGVMVLDSPEEKLYPLGIDLVGTDATYVGRIRADESLENGLNLWIVADNLRKGAALNAVQIAEIALDSRLRQQ